MKHVWMGLALVVGLLVQQASAVSYIAFEQITVAGTAIGFTTAKIRPSGLPQATQATCRVRTAELSVTWDGTTPTASVGMLLEIGDTLVLTGNDVLGLFKAIRTGSSGQLDCTYTAP